MRPADFELTMQSRTLGRLELMAFCIHSNDSNRVLSIPSGENQAMPAKDHELYAVIGDIRLSFNLLRSMADQMHGVLGINTSQRAVMESLAGQNAKTVPDIAREKGVSRQHIQVITNSLIKARLVRSHSNPDDKRTFLMSLTSHGEKNFIEIQKRETIELERLSAAFSANELQSTHDTLQKLNNLVTGSHDD